MLATIWQTVRAVFQAVSRRLLTAVALLRSQASPCVLYYKQSGSDTGFPPNTYFSPYQYHSGIAS
jgi:hypothetical protein